MFKSLLTRWMTSVTSLLLSLTLMPWGTVAQAQQTKKFHRIGFIGASSPTVAATRVDAFRQGLRALGYVEGQNLAIEFRWADGKLERIPEFAAELVALKVDVIVTAASVATRHAKAATATIPIVMGFENDPVANGVVDSLARPGGNITGVSTLAPEISGKRLELLKEMFPRATRVAVLQTAREPGTAQAVKESELAAGGMGLRLQHLDVIGPADIAPAFENIAKSRADALLVLPSPVFNSHRSQIIQLSIKNRLPVIYYAPEWVEDGGLVSYGPDPRALLRRAATYVDKILKGTKPADLPVEQPIKFEFVINLKAAKQIGLTIPPNVLVRADRVIR